MYTPRFITLLPPLVLLHNIRTIPEIIPIQKVGLYKNVNRYLCLKQQQLRPQLIIRYIHMLQLQSFQRFVSYSKPDKVIMAVQKQPRLGNFLESVYDFGKNNKNKRWFKQAISQMGLKEKWITKDQSNNRLVKILIFFSLLLLIIANILIVKCYKSSLEMKKPNWIMNDGK